MPSFQAVAANTYPLGQTVPDSYANRPQISRRDRVTQTRRHRIDKVKYAVVPTGRGPDARATGASPLAAGPRDFKAMGRSGMPLEWIDTAEQREQIIQTYGWIEAWDTSLVTHMSAIFSSKASSTKHWRVGRFEREGHGLNVYEAKRFNCPIGAWARKATIWQTCSTAPTISINNWSVERLERDGHDQHVYRCVDVQPADWRVEHGRAKMPQMSLTLSASTSRLATGIPQTSLI